MCKGPVLLGRWHIEGAARSVWLEDSAGVESEKQAIANHTGPSDHIKEFELYSRIHLKSWRVLSSR